MYPGEKAKKNFQSENIHKEKATKTNTFKNNSIFSRDRRLANRCSEFKKLLDDVISKHVRHQLIRRTDYFTEDVLLLLRCCSFQLLLNKPKHK